LALQATWSRSRSARCCGAAQLTAPVRSARSLRVRPLLPRLRGSTCHIGTRTGLTPPTCAPGLGSTCHIGTGTWADRHATRRTRSLLISRRRCSADPCEFVSDGTCDVPEDCSFGDFRDCGMPDLNATLPDAIGSLVCRSKITKMYCLALPGLSVTPSVMADARHSIRRFRPQGLRGFRPGGQRPL
jgi:hypothetical protein